MATTDRVFSFVTADGRIADLVRTRLAPLVMPGSVSFEAVREFIFRTVSQITLNYRGAPLSAGEAGDVHGGDRLPWTGAARGEGDPVDNFGPLSHMGWQVHVYGECAPGLERQCAGLGIPLHVFAWSDRFEACGLVRDGLVLLRPDTYVAVANGMGDSQAVADYFEHRQIRPAGA